MCKDLIENLLFPNQTQCYDKSSPTWNIELFNFVREDMSFTACVHIVGLSLCNWRKNKVSLRFCSVHCGEFDEHVTLKMYVPLTFFGLCLGHLWQIRTESMPPEVDLCIREEISAFFSPVYLLHMRRVLVNYWAWFMGIKQGTKKKSFMDFMNITVKKKKIRSRHKSRHTVSNSFKS